MAREEIATYDRHEQRPILGGSVTGEDLDDDVSTATMGGGAGVTGDQERKLDELERMALEALDEI